MIGIVPLNNNFDAGPCLSVLPRSILHPPVRRSGLGQKKVSDDDDVILQRSVRLL